MVRCWSPEISQAKQASPPVLESRLDRACRAITRMDDQGGTLRWLILGIIRQAEPMGGWMADAKDSGSSWLRDWRNGGGGCERRPVSRPIA